MPSRFPLLARLERALAALGVAGSGVFVATVVHGRTALVPSLAWATTAAATWLVTGVLRWLAWRRTGAATWPSLALLPAAAAALALYLDDASNHLVTLYAPARQALLAYGLITYGAAQAIFWGVLLVRRLARARTRQLIAVPIALAIAAAAYINAAVFQPWVPPQADLLTNLRGARDLLAGDTPYHDVIPVWADRVHLLPATLLLLFAPLSTLGDDPARVVFFLVNQVLWLCAVWLFVRRAAPAPDRAWWYVLALFAGATYWPWLEAIRFGQQDGLLILLFVAGLTAAAVGRWRESGLALGLAFVVKPLSIWLPLVYVVHRRWRTLFVAGATAAILFAASLPFTGIDSWLHFATVEVPEMLPGTARGTNIPLQSVHARLFVGRSRLADGDPAPSLGVISGLNVATNVLGLLLIARLDRRRRAEARSDGLVDAPTGARAWLLDGAIGLTLTLLLAPMAWQHYASWLLIAFGVLALPVVWRPLPAGARVAFALFAGAAYLLLSLDDARLLPRLEPLVERWPAVMSFYAVGLLCLLGALVTGRFAAGTARPGGAEPALARRSGAE